MSAANPDFAAGRDPDWNDVVEAHQRLSPHAHRTPALRSTTVDRRTRARVVFKAENLQRVGAFKFRGAYSAMAARRPSDRRGVVAYSSGNHAQAVALAARLLEIPATIVMPTDAPAVKRRATEDYGARLRLYDAATESREDIAIGLAEREGLELIAPFNDPLVIAGQGTAAKELFEDAGPLDALLVPCGGGGLLSGCAIAAAAIAPHCRVIGVEPTGADDAGRSFRSGVIQRIEHPDTIADGARTPSLGDITFRIIRSLVADMLTVEDQDLVAAMFFLWERMKVVVEPTGALGAAALFAHAEKFAGQRVGVLLSGGNVDLDQIAIWRQRRTGP
jgi:threonine dehydratase